MITKFLNIETNLKLLATNKWKYIRMLIIQLLIYLEQGVTIKIIDYEFSINDWPLTAWTTKNIQGISFK